MGLIKTPQTVSNTTSWEELKRFIAQVVEPLVTEVNGRLQFTSNMQTTLTTITFTATNTDTPIDHGLGSVPVGWFLVSPSAAMQVYQVTASTDKVLTLRSSAIGTAQVLAFR